MAVVIYIIFLWFLKQKWTGWRLGVIYNIVYTYPGDIQYTYNICFYPHLMYIRKQI